MADAGTALTLDELVLKGTHNSYACRGRPPCMNHPPDKQIDDFGVWHLELDFSVEYEHGGPVAVVGHDRPRNAACWGYYLSDYVRIIHRARALAYRPVFVCLEVKGWRRDRFRFWRPAPDRTTSYDDKLAAGLQALREGSDGEFVILHEFLAEHDYVWPTATELAGSIVYYEPNRRSDDGLPAGLRGTWAGRCVSPAEVESAIASGVPLNRNAAASPDGYRALRLDQYQADWTFEYGVPPNPLVVDALAPEGTLVGDAEGRRWRCGAEVSHGESVGEHGTFRFPYRSLAAAVERARGVTAATEGEADSRRAGYGWTVLVRGRPEEYPAVTPDFPLSISYEPRD